MTVNPELSPTTAKSRAARLKERVRPHMKALCSYLLPNGFFDGMNWRVGSVDGEPGRSLSIGLEGLSAGCWNDFAKDSDHGDVIALWRRVRKTDFPTTLEEMEKWLVGLPTCVAVRSKPWVASQPPRQHSSQPMPAEAERIWQAGLRRLRFDPSLQFAIDGWRGWSRGTTAHLCERQLMGLIREPGSERLLYAFLIEHPTSAGVVRVGYHSREVRSISGQKPYWSYRPNIPRDGCSVAGVPFVLGAQEVCRAKRIIVLEGQWDAIAWAAAAGWFDHWPLGTVVFGLRGAVTWKVFLGAWEPFWPGHLSFLLVPDGDEAGERWRDGFSSRLRASGHRVEFFSPPTGTDFSDLQRRHHFTPEHINSIIDMSLHRASLLPERINAAYQ